MLLRVTYAAVRSPILMEIEGGNVIGCANVQIFLNQIQLGQILRTQSSTQSGFKLMTSRLWQYIWRHWDACSNQSAISESV